MSCWSENRTSGRRLPPSISWAGTASKAWWPRTPSPRSIDLLAGHVGERRGRQVLSTLLSRMRAALVTDAIIRSALGSRIADFEDAVCDATAAQAGAEAIVTRNLRDFARATTPAVLPEALREE